jgi:hypothetical protein
MVKMTLMSTMRQSAARNTFIYTGFLISLPFWVFNTYTSLQLQIIGYTIGVDSNGDPCTGAYCLVPFGDQHLDINAVLLYMNAMTFGIGGFVGILIVAWADYWSELLGRTTDAFQS